MQCSKTFPPLRRAASIVDITWCTNHVKSSQPSLVSYLSIIKPRAEQEEAEAVGEKEYEG